MRLSPFRRCAPTSPASGGSEEFTSSPVIGGGAPKGRRGWAAVALFLALLFAFPALAVGPSEILPDPALETRARELGLFPAVVFTGNIRNQFDYLADLEILALTSDNEGTPLTIIEAMACGIPVIATDVGGVRDLLGRDERGLLVGKTDVAGFVSRLAELIADPARRQALADKGLAYVRVNHSLERLVGDLDRLYEELLAAPE